MITGVLAICVVIGSNVGKCVPYVSEPKYKTAEECVISTKKTSNALYQQLLRIRPDIKMPYLAACISAPNPEEANKWAAIQTRKLRKSLLDGTFKERKIAPLGKSKPKAKGLDI